MGIADYIFSGCIAFFLVKIAVQDICDRTISHFDLGGLLVLLLSTWLYHPNLDSLVYSFCILCVGFVLHLLKVLGAGDTKLLVVLSLGVIPEYMPLLLYGTAILGGVLALSYLVFGLLTDLSLVRKKGIPYAVPISISGGIAVFFSYISQFS